MTCDIQKIEKTEWAIDLSYASHCPPHGHVVSHLSDNRRKAEWRVTTNDASFAGSQASDRPPRRLVTSGWRNIGPPSPDSIAHAFASIARDEEPVRI